MPDKKPVKKKKSFEPELPERSILPENELKKIVPNISPTDTKKIMRLIHSGMESFSGPIPPPAILNGYEQVEKGFANRIIVMAEEEQKARHSFSKKLLSHETGVNILGIVCGFIIAMTAIIGGIIITLNGGNVAGIATIVTALGALVAVFIYGKKINEDNEKE